MKTEITILTVVALLLFVGWSIIDNQSYFGLFEVQAATESKTGQLQTEVAAAVTLTIVSGDDITFSTINPGTENDDDTTQVRTLSNKTIDLALGRDRTDPATTLASAGDTSVNIDDNDGTYGLQEFGGDEATTAVWEDGVSIGLGFTVWDASVNKNETYWGAGGTVDAAANRYAALPASDSSFTIWTTDATGTQYASIGWSLDVASTQQATTYSGFVIFKATTTP